jgi:hypothetical protein
MHGSFEKLEPEQLTLDEILRKAKPSKDGDAKSPV